MSALTPEDKMNLLTQAGVTADDAQEMVFGSAPDVIEEEVEHVGAPTVIDTNEQAPEPVVPASDENGQPSELDAAFARIIGKSYADKEKALSLCEAHGKAHFDTHKVSKIQAAAQGLDKTGHNKRAWDDAQKMVVTLKRMVRDHFRVTSVKAKIAASKQALPQAVRELDDATLERLLASEEFLALLNKESKT